MTFQRLRVPCSLALVGHSVSAPPPRLWSCVEHCRVTKRLLSPGSAYSYSWRPSHFTAMREQGGQSSFFRLSDYDCIGFDLDITILRYNIPNIVKLEYDGLAKFLVEERGYAAEFLQRPLEDADLDFLQKGLVMDYENGNVLQLASDGSILKACHGTKFLDDVALENLYGKDRCSPLTREYSLNILDTWNGPLSEKIRGCLDYFDISASLAFARCVDWIDATGNGEMKYSALYSDITAGLISMFTYDKFEKGTGNFFGPLKENPDKYLLKCSPNVVNWLRKIKEEKVTFLITGSNVDFASFTAKFCLGENWQNYFDIVICRARKPGFFSAVSRPFLKIIDGKVIAETASEIEFGCSYSEGNWQMLYELFRNKTSLSNPKCIYIGDNVVQDVYAVHKYTTCDAVAISEEICCGNENDSSIKILSSHVWGSYFVHSKTGCFSLWGDMIQKNAVICIPNLDVLADKSLDFQIQRFDCISPDLSQPFGYFPRSPYPRE